MNTVTVTGYLLADAQEAFTVKGQRKLTVDAIIDNPVGEPASWRCEFECPMVIHKAEQYLTAGRSFIFHAKLASRPYVERGVTKSITKFLLVDEAEFPARAHPKIEEKESSQAA